MGSDDSGEYQMPCYFVEGKKCPVPTGVRESNHCIACAGWAQANASMALAGMTQQAVDLQKKRQEKPEEKPDEKKDVM